MSDHIKNNYTENIQTTIAASELLPTSLHTAAQMVAICLLNGNKVLACGNGANAALAQLFTAELLNRFEAERPALPALALTADMATLSAIATDYDFSEVYAKQIRALGQEGDILLALTTSGHSRSIIKAAEAAVGRDMTIVALTGKDGGELAGLLGPNDVEVRAPTSRVPRIIETHLLNLHCLCELVDQTLFPQEGE